MAHALGRWRDARDPVTGAFAERRAAALKLDEQRETLEILRARFRRIPASQRPHYTPVERFRIVLHARTWGLSNQATSERFLVDPGTIGRWVRESVREPEKDTIGSLLKATPPLQTIDDVTRELVALLDRMRVGGSKRIAQLLARAGQAISAESVRRIRKRPPVQTPPIGSTSRSTDLPALRAKSPNHIWMTDITSIPSLFGLWSFKLVVVLDVFSRYPLAFRAFPGEPSSDAIASLVRGAVARFGSPSHFVTDRGSQFTGEAFVSALRDLGIAQRFGAIGKSGSIAIIERFWRSMKEMIDSRFMPPLSLRHLHQKADCALFYYATLRPHQGLAGATPTEIYFGLAPAIAEPPPPPRDNARARPDTGGPPFQVAWLDLEHRLPFLIPSRRAA
jgi:transposase InsO family protein